jgi:hypothetical protein
MEFDKITHMEPTLAIRNLPVNKAAGRRVPMTFKVIGGLNFLKGNAKPYFSITVEQHRKGFPEQCQSGGCQHDELLKYFPKFAPLVALHLSDIDGVPMHAEANGWYWLAGALPNNACQQYHGGNSQQHFPKPEGAPRRGSWDNTDYRNPTPDESVAIFAKHVRCSIEDAQQLRTFLVDRYNERAAHEASRPERLRRPDGEVWSIVRREYFTPWIESQKNRWKQEAENAIATFNLKVYGDKWPVEQ